LEILKNHENNLLDIQFFLKGISVIIARCF
jgi:hypothetical protein